MPTRDPGMGKVRLTKHKVRLTAMLRYRLIVKYVLLSLFYYHLF
jgi:hypothetical protein